MHTCSHCPQRAEWEGTRYPDGTVDAELYCADHIYLAPNGVAPMSLEIEAKVRTKAMPIVQQWFDGLITTGELLLELAPIMGPDGQSR